MSERRALGEEEWRRLVLPLGLSPGATAGLVRFLGILDRWSAAVDLVGRVTPEELVSEHTAESLAGSALLPEGGAVLDVGSGNGFPIVPLLVARRDLRGVLLEPRERRWAFLREAVRELGLAAEVRRERLAEHRGVYDAITVRAVAAAAWGPLAAPLLREGGVLLWWTGRAAAEAAAPPGLIPVLHSPLPVPERGVIAVWRRCST